MEVLLGNEKTTIISYKWIDYEIISDWNQIKIFYNLWDEKFEIDIESPLYKEILDFKNWIKNIQENTWKNTKDLLGTYNIDDIKENINIEEEIDKVIFSYNEQIIWVIKFNFIDNNSIFLEFVWTTNAKKEDFDDLPESVKNNYLESFDFSQNLKIRWLWEYIYEEFINILKNKNIKYIKSEIFNEKVFDIKDKLKTKWIIKKYYKDNNWIDIIEL